MTTTMTRPSGNRSKLAAIATTMYSNVTAPGAWDRAKLQNGLDIILHRVDDHQWRLATACSSRLAPVTDAGAG